MPEIIDNRTVKIDGTSFDYLVSIDADAATIADPILAAAQAGTLTTRSAATTAVTVMVPHVESFVLDVSNCQALVVQAAGGVPCVARFRDVSVADIETLIARTGSDLTPWVNGGGGTCPLGSDVVTVMLTHGSTTARKVRVYAPYN